LSTKPPKLWVIEYEDNNGMWWPLDVVHSHSREAGRNHLERQRAVYFGGPFRIRPYVRLETK